MQSPLCAGLLEGTPAERPPLLQLLHQAVPLLLADLEAQGQALDEQLYLQLARVAGIMGEPDKVGAWHNVGMMLRAAFVVLCVLCLHVGAAVPAAGSRSWHHGGTR
jgi:hypothetical protein